MKWPACWRFFFDPAKFFRVGSVLSLQGGQSRKKTQCTVSRILGLIWCDTRLRSSILSNTAGHVAGWMSKLQVAFSWAAGGPRGVQIVYRGKCLHEHYQTLLTSVHNTWIEEYGWFQRLWRLREHLWLWFDLHILQFFGIKLLKLGQKTNS